MIPLSLILLVAAAPAAETKPEVRELVRKSLAGLNKEDQKMDDYGFVRRWQRIEYNSDGSVRSKQTGASRRELVDGYWIGRTFERDGKPVAADEKLKQEEAIRKYLAERKAVSDAEWERRRAANRKSSEQDEWVQEFPEALDYKIVGEEAVNGRTATILEASPRPGYQPKNMRARVFEKMRGKLWVDRQEGELVKADAEVFETVNIGFGILGKVEKGTKFYLERRKVAPDFWVVSDQMMKFDARIMLVKTLKQEVRQQRAEFVHRSELGARAASPAVRSGQ